MVELASLNSVVGTRAVGDISIIRYYRDHYFLSQLSYHRHKLEQQYIIADDILVIYHHNSFACVLDNLLLVMNAKKHCYISFKIRF